MIECTLHLVDGKILLIEKKEIFMKVCMAMLRPIEQVVFLNDLKEKTHKAV